MCLKHRALIAKELANAPSAAAVAAHIVALKTLFLESIAATKSANARLVVAAAKSRVQLASKEVDYVSDYDPRTKEEYQRLAEQALKDPKSLDKNQWYFLKRGQNIYPCYEALKKGRREGLTKAQ